MRAPTSDTRSCPTTRGSGGARSWASALQSVRRSGFAEGLFHALERAMSESPGYTEYHPRWFRPRVSTYWWLGRRSYLAFILRELSSIFVAWFVVYLLLLVRAVSEGESSYRQFLGWSGRPVVLLINVVGLSFVVFHAITWF